jgi:iron complex transport system ATP-binding protein
MSESADPLMQLCDLRFGFANRPDFLGPIDLSVLAGDCWAILGPNGAGKTTLLKLMAGLLTPSQGSVRLVGREWNSVSPRDRARIIAYLPQLSPTDLDFSVREIVLMGRYPHRSLGLFESTADFELTDRAMQTTDTWRFADRRLSTLSGGEAQRVHLAAALVQAPSLLLLDEPTASLDLHHQITILEILRERAAQDRVGVVFVTHDVNLAAQFASHVLLLDDGKVAASGPPDKVIEPAVLEPVYRVNMTAVGIPNDPQRRFVAVLSDRMVSAS